MEQKPFAERYDAQDETVQKAQNMHRSPESKSSTARARRRASRNSEVDSYSPNPLALGKAVELAMGDDGKVDYGRLEFHPDGNITVWNSEWSKNNRPAPTRAKNLRKKR